MDADGKKLSKKEHKKLLKERESKLREKVRRLIQRHGISLGEIVSGTGCS